MLGGLSGGRGGWTGQASALGPFRCRGLNIEVEDSGREEFESWATRVRAGRDSAQGTHTQRKDSPSFQLLESHTRSRSPSCALRPQREAQEIQERRAEKS